MEIDAHLANAVRTPKEQLARHIVRDHGMIYPLLKDLRKWRKEELIQSHLECHVRPE
jgi:hypothetical protein